MSVRTRIAPSPTGRPHLGTGYVALFNYCMAKSGGGQFILRVEDTDRARSSQAAEDAIMSSLRWLGLDWDEGPDCGGASGPYRQSERGDIYRKYAGQLLDGGHAYRCHRTAGELAQLRAHLQRPLKQADLALPDAERRSREASGAPSVIRLRTPGDGDCTVHDMLRGEVRTSWQQVDDQVLLKADGLPTYHLANVVDDHLMGISHVIRGEEWLSSAPKHLLLYGALGWDMPMLCHLPLLRNADKSKLSKRKNPTGINYYRALGYLPQALINYLGQMGWSMPDGDEVFGLQEMVEHFDISRVHLGGPAFDHDKLAWINGQHLRALDDADFADAVRSWGFDAGRLAQIMPLARQRISTLSELAEFCAPFFTGLPQLQDGSFDNLRADKADCRRILQYSIWQLEDASLQWDAGHLERSLDALATAMELKKRDFLAPLFVAISGRPVCPPLFRTLAIIGPDLGIGRLRHALHHLGAPSKKEAKAWQKQYAALPTAHE